MVYHLVYTALQELLLYFLQLAIMKIVIESKFINMCNISSYLLYTSWPFCQQVDFFLYFVYFGKIGVHLRYT